MTPRQFYDKRMAENPLIGSVQLMDEYAQVYHEQKLHQQTYVKNPLSLSEMIDYLLSHENFNNDLEVSKHEVLCDQIDSVLRPSQIEEIRNDTGWEFYIIEKKFCFKIPTPPTHEE